MAEEVEAMGYDLVTVEWAGAPKHRVVRVYLDRAADSPPPAAEPTQGAVAAGRADGISLDEITKLTPIVSAALDAAEGDPQNEPLRRLLQAGYTLECSSPGIERPLAKVAHFNAFIGRRITVRTFEPITPGKKQRTFHGFVQRCEPDPASPDDPYAGTLSLREADGDAVYDIPLPAIKRAHLVYEETS